MPLLGFTVHKKKIQDREKRQTIRAMRKYPIQKGDTLYIYWKLRTKQCKKLLETKCTEAFTITMEYFADWLGSGEPVWRLDRYVKGGMYALIDLQVEDLAKRDGFSCAREMMEWFSNQYKDLNSLEFQVIRW